MDVREVGDDPSRCDRLYLYLVPRIKPSLDVLGNEITTDHGLDELLSCIIIFSTERMLAGFLRKKFCRIRHSENDLRPAQKMILALHSHHRKA